MKVGQLTYRPAERPTGSPKTNPAVWLLTAQPHVMMRLKRIFPRVRQAATGVLEIKATEEVARELEWVLDRFPLEVDTAAAPVLQRDAEQYRRRTLAVQSILGEGYVAPSTHREAARPSRLYQKQAANIVLEMGRLLLADQVGLGKTQSALEVLLGPDALPAVVITLTHLPRQWEGEIKTVLPWLQTHIAKKGTPYPVVGMPLFPVDVIILNYAKLGKGWGHALAGHVKTVIFDEIQELRHDGSDKYNQASMLAEAAVYRMGLSATPVYNYGGEIYNIMQVLAPDALGSKEEFNREWGGVSVGMGGNVQVGDSNALGTYLREQALLLRRTREEVGREIPEPTLIEQQVETDPDLVQRLAGDVAAMAELVLSSDSSWRERGKAASELDWRLRHATGVAKAPFVAAFVRFLLESEERVVLGGWHHDVYKIWMEHLAEFNPVLYTGEQSPNQKAASLADFTSGKSRVFIMSVRAGAGLDGLQHVCTCAVVGELDWSPGVHEQFVGRLARDGQLGNVVAFFTVSPAGSDPFMAQVLDIKRQQAESITDPQRKLFTPVASTDRIKDMARNLLARRRLT